MSGCSSTSSSRRNAAAVKAIANFAVFLKRLAPSPARNDRSSTASPPPVHSVVRATDVGVVGVRAEAPGDERSERGAEQNGGRRPPTPASPRESHCRAERRRGQGDAGQGRAGGSTIPSGVKVSESSITPSARGSEGPGTNVDDARIEMASPWRSGRAGIATFTSS